MSTANLYMNDQDIELFIQKSQSRDAMYTFGYENQDHYGIGPYFTCYVHHTVDQVPEIIDKFLHIFNEFSEIIDEPYQWFTNIFTEAPVKASKYDLSKLKENCLKFLNTDRTLLIFEASTDKFSLATSSIWSLGFAIETFRPEKTYSTIKINYRHAWYYRSAENRRRWHQFMQNCISLLNPI